MVVIRNLAFALLLALPAHAQPRDSDLPPVDPPGRWRQMTLDDATTDSKCVGKFDTALCAVETVIACSTRHLDELCTRASLDAGERGFFLDRPPRPDALNRYRVSRVERLTNRTIQEIPRWTDGVRAGDVRIDVQWRLCPTDDATNKCRPPNRSFIVIYTVRRTDLGWRLVDRGGPDIRWPGPRRPQSPSP
jgi:hypothetical protein